MWGPTFFHIIYIYRRLDDETPRRCVRANRNRTTPPPNPKTDDGTGVQLAADWCENMEGELEGTGQMQIIGGLPDDIALFCLARVPRRYHTVLKCVSRRWRDLVCSEEWHAYRGGHDLSETWIYALCRDRFDRTCCYVLDPGSSRRCWKRIQGMPPHCSKRKGMGFQVIGKKVYLLGGCGWSEDATSEAYCYDVSANSWTEATPMSTPRCYFACEVLEGKISAIGGLGSNLSNPHSWDTFDPRSNSWELHSDENIVHDVEDSVVLDGKIYFRGGESALPPHLVLYDLACRTWQHAGADMELGWQGPSVVIDDTLYVLDQNSGTRLMMWEKDKREWVAIGRLSPLLTRPPCRLVATGRKIFVVGKGLRTVVFDIDKTGNMGGIMVGTSINGLDSDDDVISCKCVAL